MQEIHKDAFAGWEKGQTVIIKGRNTYVCEAFDVDAQCKVKAPIGVNWENRSDQKQKEKRDEYSLWEQWGEVLRLTGVYIMMIFVGPFTIIFDKDGWPWRKKTNKFSVLIKLIVKGVLALPHAVLYTAAMVMRLIIWGVCVILGVSAKWFEVIVSPFDWIMYYIQVFFQELWIDDFIIKHRRSH